MKAMYKLKDWKPGEAMEDRTPELSDALCQIILDKVYSLVKGKLGADVSVLDIDIKITMGCTREPLPFLAYNLTVPMDPAAEGKDATVVVGFEEKGES